MKDKYTFVSVHKDIVAKMQKSHKAFSEEFAGATGKAAQKSAYDTLYSDAQLTNVGNYVTYFQKIKDPNLLDFIVEQVQLMKTALSPVKK